MSDYRDNNDVSRYDRSRYGSGGRRPSRSENTGEGRSESIYRSRSRSGERAQRVERPARAEGEERQSPRSYDRSRYSSRGASSSNRRSQADYTVRDRRGASRGTSSSDTPRRSNAPAHSGGANPLAGKLPIIVVAGLVIIALVVFGLSRCTSCSSSKPASSSETATSAAVETPEVTEEQFLPTPFIAEGSSVALHSAVRVDQLTEILIHNASYSYACALKTKLTEATNTEVMANHGTGRVASEQPTGDAWLTGEFIRCYRDGNAGPKMSAIDCGGPVGATVYAPVSGTVVKVKEYDLYNNSAYPDIQIHIQPDGRSDIDVVLIHLTDPTVAEGDTVIGGVTPIASIRDVYAYIGEEMQLKQYTAEGDNGNHTHIQINDATNKEYHGLD